MNRAFNFCVWLLKIISKHHWEGLLCKRNRLLKPETVTTHPQITLKQTAKLAGSSPAIARQLIQAEIVTVFQAQPSKRRRNYAINRRQVRQIAELTKNCVSLKESAKNLNLPVLLVYWRVNFGCFSFIIFNIGFHSPLDFESPFMAYLHFGRTSLVGSGRVKTQVPFFENPIKYTESNF